MNDVNSITGHLSYIKDIYTQILLALPLDEAFKHEGTRPVVFVEVRLEIRRGEFSSRCREKNILQRLLIKMYCTSPKHVVSTLRA